MNNELLKKFMLHEYFYMRRAATHRSRVNMDTRCLFLIVLLGVGNAQQQSTERCFVIGNLTEGRNEIFGDCDRSEECTEINCTNVVNLTPRTEAGYTLTFRCNSASQKVDLIFVATEQVNGGEITTVANRTIRNMTERVVDGTLDLKLYLMQINDDVTFGVSSESQGTVFENTTIPFNCDEPTTDAPTTDAAMRSQVPVLMMVAAAALSKLLLY